MDVLFIAGEIVPPGVYQEIRTRKQVRLEHPDCLPASVDGTVATYVRAAPTWGEIIQQRASSRNDSQVT